MKTLKEMNEQELKAYKVPWPETIEELNAIINELVDRDLEYGTCPYAMSISALATFYYVSHKLGVSGFQASCADMDFLARSRGMKYGFSILNNEHLLFPQYADEFDKGFSARIRENIGWLSKEAAKLLDENNDLVHGNVKKHWRKIVDIGTEL